MNGIWIRSQDRTDMELCNNLWVEIGEDVDGNEKITIESEQTILGTYATKSRALEVLDEIQRHINDQQVYIDGEGKITLSPLAVFEMPLK